MAMSMEPLGGGKSGRFGARFRPRAEINVTPFVDVMLVLLIVFMVTAPLLTIGELVDLPNTRSKALPADQKPLAVIVQNDGTVLIQETPIAVDELSAKLRAIAVASERATDERIHIYGDEGVSYGRVIAVMAEITGAGFTNIALVTEPVQE